MNRSSRPGRRPARDSRHRAPSAPAETLPIHSRLVLGQQCTREAVRRWGQAVRQVYVERDPNPRLAALQKFAEDQGVVVRHVARAQLDRLAGGSIHQGVAADAPELQLVQWDEVARRPDLLAVALDGVVDPQNFGAVIRSAVGIAGAAVLWAESSSAPLSPATFRASAGAVEHAQLCRVASLHGTLEEAAHNGATILGLAPEADLTISDEAPTGPLILVVGSEQKGMGRAVRRACTQLVRLHQSGFVQSLNASVAAGIALHHVVAARTRAASGR